MHAALGLLLLTSMPLASHMEAQSRYASIDSAFRRVDVRGQQPAVGVVVVHQGKIAYLNTAGFADLERHVRASASTRFDIASLAKQFTAFSVSQLVSAGQLRTTDTVARFLPELDLGGAAITIDQLLHHTSGLEDTDGLFALAGGRGDDPVTHEDMVRLLVRQQHLRFAPGTQHAYSNGGYSLLAEVVSRVRRQSFLAYTDSAVFGPLGMRHTTFVNGTHMFVPNRALPYAKDGGGVLQPSSADTYPAAGGLYATMEDLGRWMLHLIEPARDSMATLRLRETGTLSSGAPLTYAWGLGVERYRGRLRLSHAGSGPATAAQMFVFPELGFGVLAAIAGDVEINPATLARQIVDLVIGSQLESVPTPKAGAPRMLMITDSMMRTAPEESRGVAVDTMLLRRYAGTYQMPDSQVLTVRYQKGALELATDGRPPYFPLFPLPDGRFVQMPLWEVFRFELAANDAANRIVRERTAKSLRPPSAPVTGTRKSDRTFDAATAAPYVGSYYSDELGAMYEVRRRGARLYLSHPRLGDLPLLDLGSDDFGIDGGGLVKASFQRNGDTAGAMQLEARSWGVTAWFRRVDLMPR